jgi:hypothetical protein
MASFGRYSDDDAKKMFPEGWGSPKPYSHRQAAGLRTLAFAFLKPPAADCAAIPVEVTIASVRVALPTSGPADTTVEAFGYAKRSISILG